MSPHKPDHSEGWLRSIVGNVMLSAAGGGALLFVVCLLFARDEVPWWISLAGLGVCGLLAWWGDSVRTRKIYLDPETGRVKKNNL